MNKPVPMNLDRFATMIDGSTECLRIWVRPDGANACFVNPVPLGPDPIAFGQAMVDAVRQAACAYARAVNIDEHEALARIWVGVDAERVAVPADPVSFTQRDGSALSPQKRGGRPRRPLPAGVSIPP